MSIIFCCTCTQKSILTNDVLGNMLARYFNWLAESDLVHGSDAALVLSLVNEVLDDIVGLLQIPGDIAADPVCGIRPLALHQVSNDRASTIIGGSSPGEADGAVGGVRHSGVHNGSRRSWVRAHRPRLDYTESLICVSYSPHIISLGKNYAKFSEFMGLTDWILCSGASGGLAGFAKPCNVDSNDSELILGSFCEACKIQAPLCHGLPVHLGPVNLLGLFLFQHIAQDGGLSIICRLLPAHSHTLLGHICNHWGLARARHSWK